jgi:hypothetical protein
VRCACNVERKIDTSVLRPWRVRCKRCKQVLFDPSSTMVVGNATVQEESTQELNRWVSGSHEHIRPLNLNETSEAMRCPTHPLQQVIAGCKQCNRLLCRACVDQVGESLVCSDCVGQQNQAHGSATIDGARQAPAMSPREVLHAFERQLLMAGMEAWLERPPHGGARMIQVVYDAPRRVFKAPLDPVMAYGDQIRFPDGRLFAVQAVRNVEVERVPCYQEIEANQVG